MARKTLILDRYEPLGTAGAGGFGTVQIAWDPRIQRKVAIKTIELTEYDAYRAGLPGAQAVARKEAVAEEAGAAKGSAGQAGPADAVEGGPSMQGELKEASDGARRIPESSRVTTTAERWHGALPWNEYLEGEGVEALPGASVGHVGQDDSRAESDAVRHDGQPAGAGQVAADVDEPIAPGESISLLHSDPVTSLAHVPGLDEARTAAMLTDPRIVAVYDFEVRDCIAYLIMEYVEGITLTKLLHEYEDHLTLDVVTCVFDAVAGALSAAHGAGVLHLDIKPDNILINAKGQAKVTDFGLATLADASGSGTTGGGTIGYMPLEQMRREHLDARADEWSLAAVLYEMLTGDNPFRARNLAEAESAILDAELVLPSLCWEVIDAQIDDVVFYALDPDRDERYGSVEDFAEEADKFLGDADLGQEQLAFVVADALSEDEPEPSEAQAVEPSEQAPAPVRPARSMGKGFFGAVGSLVGDAVHRQVERQTQAVQGQSDYEAGYHAGYDAGVTAGDAAYEDVDGEEGRSRRRFPFGRRWRSSRADAQSRVPLAERVPSRLIDVSGRMFCAFAAGLLAYFACSGIDALPSLLGSAALYGELAVALALAIVGAIRPDVGALASYCLFGAAIVICGHPLVGGSLALFAALWFYITGREGMANANVSLLAPLAGCIGAASAVPFAGGASLRPVQAGVTVAFATVVAAVFASLGSGTFIGWDVFAYADFRHADITRNMVNLLLLPSTWTTAAGWIIGAVALSLFDTRGGRAGLAIGLVLCVVAVLIGALVFSAPTPQLFLSVAAAAVILFVAR